VSASESAVLSKAVSTSKKVHCDLDDWDFDPRYTRGACPICGWRPEAEAKAEATWMTQVRELPWDLIFLVGLFVILLVAGVLVARAAGIRLTPQGY
jgi:hypothetical protein